MKWKPELLAPAKNLERLKVAISYGADAVYLGGQRYGLRARADNFTDVDIIQAVDFAHHHHAKIYITLNAFLHDEDFEGLENYCSFLEKIGVDAVIVSDLGVLNVVRRSSKLEIHLSTQASCLNSYAAQIWKEMGVKRLILGRESSILEAGEIRQQTDIDTELFIHGAMCIAFSGHCAISNFTAGRDSNRGGCSQSCRHPYVLYPKDEKREVSSQMIKQSSSKDELITFLSSKDLQGIRQIRDFFEQKISSIKIEGRMKSSLYVATTCKVYRHLLDAEANHSLDEELLEYLEKELDSIPHRDYFSGSLEQKADKNSTHDQAVFDEQEHYKYLGIILDDTKDFLVMRLYESLAIGDTIEFLPFETKAFEWQVDSLFSLDGEKKQSGKNDSIICLPKKGLLQQLTRFNVARIAPII